MTSTPITIYRLRVAVADIVPPIWRVVDVPADFSLDWLHSVIQWSMGWEHEHPYRFHRRDIAYVEGPVDHELGPDVERDATHDTLQKVYGRRGRYLRYVYDMKDSWWHHVWLEDVFLAAPETEYPRLIDGARACPPEGFGGLSDYRAYLNGKLDDDDPRIPEMKGFDPENFDPTPRPFPNARIYESGDKPAPPTRPDTMAPIVVEMLDDLAEWAEEILDETDDEFRPALRRAIEDVVLAEDALPPATADTLQKARSMNLGLEDFLIDCVRDHDMLRDNLSTAPFHAAHLLALWKTPEAVPAFMQVARETPQDEEGLIHTMLDALVWSGDAGVESLLDELEELPKKKRLAAMDRLCREGVRDERLFDQLQEAMKDAGPHNARVPVLLGQYENGRAAELLFEALDDEIEFLTDDSNDADDDERAARADYALFLTEMLGAAGETLDRERFDILEEIEDFYWPSPAYKKRLRGQ